MTIWILSSLLASMLGTALITGLLFAFSICVMSALARVPPQEGMRIMQTINRVILNRLFVSIFFGTTVLSVINAISVLMGWGGDAPDIFIAATAFYLVGVFWVTAQGNVPMNNKLDALDVSKGEAYWRIYLKDWTRLNHLRTSMGTVSIVLYALGFVQTNFPY